MRSPAAQLARLLATLLVAAWVAQPLAVAAHGEAHGHSYCAEHRTFEDDRAAGPALAGERGGDTPRLARGDAETAPRHHAACPVISVRTQAAHASPGGAVLPVLAAHHAKQAGAAVAASPPLSALDTAPKSSPPA